MKRYIELENTEKMLVLSKFATPKTEKQFIHLDELPDGTWRLLFNVEGVDIQKVKSFIIHRED